VVIFVIGWSDEQIEGWRIMLERNVSLLLLLLLLHVFIGIVRLTT
jgi:hypothetical protein